MIELNTVDDVIEAIGRDALMALTGARSTSVISNWKTFGKFPRHTFVVITTELAKQEKRAPASLWNMREPAEAAE